MEKSPKDDSGLTLIELLVTMMLSIIVLGLLASMIVGIYLTQTSVSQSSSASSQAQVASDAFRSAVRSSTATAISAVTVDGVPGQYFIARSLSAKEPTSLTPGARCVAFLWKSGTPGSLYWASAASKGALPASTTTTGWTQLVQNASAIDLTTSVFSKTGYKHQMTFIATPLAGPTTTLRVGVLAPKLAVEQWGTC